MNSVAGGSGSRAATESAAPSSRQNFSVSSSYLRLHFGQRFIGDYPQISQISQITQKYLYVHRRDAEGAQRISNKPLTIYFPSLLNLRNLRNLRIIQRRPS